MKILVVEDNKRDLDLLIELIKVSWKIDDVPLEIVGCSTMEAALNERHDTNVTILDLDLPDSSISNTIASIERFRPPVIVLTGDDNPEVINQCLAAGAEHVFHKGACMRLIPSIFEAMQKDILRTASLRHEPRSLQLQPAQ